MEGYFWISLNDNVRCLFCKSFIVWNFLNCIINIYSADRSKYGNITVSDTFLFTVLSFCFHDTLFSNSIIINTFLPKLRSSARKIKTQFLNPKFSLYLSRFRSMTNKKFFWGFCNAFDINWTQLHVITLKNCVRCL